MPTGGVDTTKENIEGWFKAGVCAVGMGSKLISKKLMEAKDYGTIETETKKVLELIGSIKQLNSSTGDERDCDARDADKNYLSWYHKKIYDATSHRKIQVDDLCPVIFCYYYKLSRQASVESVAEPILSELFGWTNTDYANITAVFQFGYAISHAYLPDGSLINLEQKKDIHGRLLSGRIGAMIHALAIPIGEGIKCSIWMVWYSSFKCFCCWVLWFARAVLAFGEAGNFPAAIKATAEYFPKKERSFATGIFNSGANVGAILAPLTVPWIGKNWGWEVAFIIMGAIGFIWLFFWLVFYEKPERTKKIISCRTGIYQFR